MSSTITNLEEISNVKKFLMCRLLIISVSVENGFKLSQIVPFCLSIPETFLNVSKFRKKTAESQQCKNRSLLHLQKRAKRLRKGNARHQGGPQRIRCA